MSSSPEGRFVVSTGSFGASLVGLVFGILGSLGKSMYPFKKKLTFFERNLFCLGAHDCHCTGSFWLHVSVDSVP